MALSYQSSSQQIVTLSDRIEQDLFDLQSFLDQIRSFKLPDSNLSYKERLPLSALRFEENN